VASDSVKDESFVVRGLRPGTSYRFIVRAENSHGLSLPSPVTGVVKTKGERDSRHLYTSSYVKLKLICLALYR